MAGKFKKEDLRITKTYNNLINAMLTLLNKRMFGKITVYDLCEEALVSRATFYTHFEDKYNLLKYWLIISKENVTMKIHDINNLDEKIEIVVDNMNIFMLEHSVVIKNIVNQADSELMQLVQDFITSIIEGCIDEENDNTADFKRITITNFCAGGMLNHLLWNVKHEFPQEMVLMNKYICISLCYFLECIEDKQAQ